MSRPSEQIVLAAVEDHYRSLFDTQPIRASVSFVGVDPIEILKFDDRLGLCYLTLGMSRIPMPSGAAAARASYSVSSLDPAQSVRAELMLLAEEASDDVWRKLAVLAAAPAVQAASYRPGDRVDLGGPWHPRSQCVGALLQRSDLGPVLIEPALMVDVLQVLPATGDELAWARIHGSEALAQRWRQASTQLCDLTRAPVSLR